MDRTGGADLGNGLVLHYEFDGNINDSSVNGYHGTAHGATLTTDQFGNPDSAYHFDGTDDYIDIGTSLGGFSSFSEFVWVKIDALNPRNNFIQSSNWYQSDTLGNDGGFDLAITNGYVKSWVNQPDRTDGSVLAGPYIELGKWYSIGFTWDGSTHRQYFDGMEVASESYTGYIGTSAKTSLIGAKHYGLGLTGFLNGDIDDVRIYDRALSDVEIRALAGDPVALVQELAQSVIDLNLPKGVWNRLDAKLDTALQALDDLDYQTAVNALASFINAVEAQRDKKIQKEDADALIEAAQQIINFLNKG
jgi:hypothetical protein